MESASAFAPATSPPSAAVPVRQTDRGRAFISGHPLTRTTLDGQPAVVVKVRLTSYRSLPLSCVERIALSIDGTEIPEDDLRFVLGASTFRLSDLAAQSTVWWFILDHAELVVRTPEPLSQGTHVIAGTLVTVEPYISNGRFHFHFTSTRELEVRP
ncbi:hypothetical protein FPZ12_016170 [Amycolatopsis acidicola]|uniref:C-deglycosylation enzyme beta subunit n=1 Tax=Amycolatopsis acidicola TaxID=2596893 RepID=A0A5N0V2T8_9PSEU|nr:DUF6379 domain-containing protein [Amycolatopsis acidicola]KAA9160686.1 hypothetical protein FPZ12_016170 [Amycolatopsis acidicola]